MRLMTSAIVAALFAFVPCSALAQSGDAAVVKALELKRFQAMEKNDLSALDELLADDLIYTHSSGQPDTKAQFVEALRTGKTRYVKIAPADTIVTTFGDTSLIRGRAHLMIENQSGKSEFTISYLDVWLKRGGKWQMVAWQSARLPPAAQ